MNKKTARTRRMKKCRARIKRLVIPKLCVHRTPRHIYAQIISAEGDVILVCASSVEKEFKGKHKVTGNMKAASDVGKLIAERAKSKDVVKIAFDRSGFKYHGRVKALAEAAREGGLEF
jgi:large subunit ribosomal protein L18